MKRKFILIFFSLIIIGTAAYFYIDTVFLPVQFKSFVTSKAEKFLNRQVSIGSIDFKPFQGLIFENIAVSRKDDPDEFFLKSEKITFNILLAPFFQKKAIIIPNIKIDKPYITIERNKKGQWNFSDLLALRRSSSRNNVPPILLRKLRLEDGGIHFTDKAQKEEFTEIIEGIFLNTTLSLNKGVRFTAQAKIPKYESIIEIKGNHGIITQKLTAQVTTKNIHLTRYQSLFKTSAPYVQLDKGILSDADLSVVYGNQVFQAQGSLSTKDAIILVGENKSIAGNVEISNMFFSWQDQKWDIKGHLKLPDILLSSVSGKKLKGNLTADLNSFTIDGKDINSTGNITIENTHLFIGKDMYLKGNIKATDASLSKTDGGIKLQGNIETTDTLISVNEKITVDGNLSTEKVLFTWSLPDKDGNRALHVKGGLQMDSAQLKLGPDRFIRGSISAPKTDLTYSHKIIEIEAQGQIDDAYAQFKSDQQFEGNPHFNISYLQDFKNSDPAEYKGVFHFKKSQIRGIPTIEEISNLEGTITAIPDNIQTNELTFNTLDTHIQLSGQLTKFDDPDLDVSLSSDNVEIEKLLALLPKLNNRIRADITGKAKVEASYKGSIHSPAEATIESSAQISQSTIMLHNLDDDITNVSGQLEYKKDLLKWNNLLANYKNRSYSLTGQLQDFSRPVVDTTVSAEQLSLSTQIKILRQAFQLTKFDCDYLNSHFDIKGDVHFFEDTDADIDLRGKVTVDMQDIGLLIPRLKNIIYSINPKGTLAAEGLYRGKLKDWRNWQLIFDAESSKILINDYPFENIAVHYAQRDQTINKFNATSMIYDGLLNIISSADLQDADIPFTASMAVENLSLQRFREDRKPKIKELSGLLNMSADLKGYGRRWRQFTGEGSFDISEGYLWKWNILDGISGILLIPEFKSMAFNEAHGDFIIENQKIFTENTTLIGNRATLTGKGSIDFDKNLNFNITPDFSKLAILESESMKKKSTAIFTQTDGYINIKLTGTLDKPRFSVKKFPMKIIEETIGGTTDTLKEVIGSIVDEIF